MTARSFPNARHRVEQWEKASSDQKVPFLFPYNITLEIGTLKINFTSNNQIVYNTCSQDISHCNMHAHEHTHFIS